ncbi:MULTISPECIES: CdaR family transcriptional regulator [Dietzia]|uniref:PucR family transcriptional regulator n=1 Tax=Dietzia TaxID=37914 RepID=UPI0015606E7D|nr:MULTISPECIES: PucR family transcriptional regulator [Dietzia]
MGATDPERIGAFIRSLELDETMIGPTIERVRQELESYRATADTELEDSVRRNLRLSVQTLRKREVPSPGDIWEAETATLQRLQAGLPIEDILAGFRVSMTGILDRAVVLAEECGLPERDIVWMTGLLWKLSDAFSARAAVAYRTHGLEVALAERRRRDSWLHDLLTGSLSAAQIDQGAVMYHLPRDMTYRAFCTSAHPVHELEAIRSRLASDREELILPSEGRLIGLLREAPTDFPLGTLALGPPRALSEAMKSFTVAEDVLAAAEGTIESGVVTVDSLGWRMAVSRIPATLEVLRERYLEPLDVSGALKELIPEALEAYLAHGRSIPKAAESLYIHVNTLRYRLSRFEEVTGCSLESTDTIVELALLLYRKPRLS